MGVGEGRGARAAGSTGLAGPGPALALGVKPALAVCFLSSVWPPGLTLGWPCPPALRRTCGLSVQLQQAEPPPPPHVHLPGIPLRPMPILQDPGPSPLPADHPPPPPVLLPAPLPRSQQVPGPCDAPWSCQVPATPGAAVARLSNAQARGNLSRINIQNMPEVPSNPRLRPG